MNPNKESLKMIHEKKPRGCRKRLIDDVIEIEPMPRQRGRPPGGLRPLTKYEQAQRNAAYESERRRIEAAATKLLIDQLGVDNKITKMDLLREAINTVKRLQEDENKLKKEHDRLSTIFTKLNAKKEALKRNLKLEHEEKETKKAKEDEVDDIFEDVNFLRRSDITLASLNQAHIPAELNNTEEKKDAQSSYEPFLEGLPFMEELYEWYTLEKELQEYESENTTTKATFDDDSEPTTKEFFSS